MRLLVMFLLLIGLSSCKSENQSKSRAISEVEIKTLLQDSLLNVRAIAIDENNNLNFATSNGEIGGKSMNLKNQESVVINFIIKHDSIIPNFRSISITEKGIFVFGISSPALLYKIDTDSLKLVYKETHPKAFYDSMDFWNDREGIAMGDPTDDCISIIITRDSGETWTKLSCDDLPKAKEGEAAFAASDTNIAIVGNETWIATGGRASRILYSNDKGKTWQIYKTPIIQGKLTTGIYSLDFYDAKNGFAIGGDYTDANANTANKIRTYDGGKTWEVVANGQSPGYRSCIQYIPSGNANELVAVGFKGIDYSKDAGESWKHLSDEGFYTIRFLNDSIAYAAGSGLIAKLIFR
ncbi:MAG: oxidoreductase [Winogradskyella sp.]|uniref:WD40/YVTN/BNR-like repeat-containing protein n=1 Tax=Winogradskyella sp. TaxID=1883156 RepID=UPI001800812A|nr:oxidoreductase [Winogradskyella sp.]MBT8244584.1 oxidoreductase [Winogradskyella sp.]NNK23096.1 oxidoreductase [Winogradskyella sp.]